MKSLSPLQFEHFVAEVFRRQGFTAEVTKGSGDEGIDILLRKGNATEIVQCKRWATTPVGSKILYQLLGSCRAAKASRAHLVTTSFLSKAARKVSADPMLEVVEGFDLVTLVEKTFRADELPAALAKVLTSYPAADDPEGEA